MADKIIIDTDPGQDDAVAILLALASPEIEVLGLTTVAGNVPLRLTTVNALKVCELAGRSDMAVHPGADRPLDRELVTAEQVHGAGGLGGPDLPEPVMAARSEHAVDFILRTLRAEPAGSVTLCVLGPMTNIALALAKAPDVVARVARIVAMGGGYTEGGNTTPVAEFNIHVDPKAAAEVFASGVPIVLMPLDVTHQCMVTRARARAFRALDSRAGIVVAEMMEFSERFDVEKYGTDGAPLHDPCVIAWLLAPEMFQGKDVNVEVETRSELTLGQTVIDWWGVTDRARNAHVVRKVDAEAFFELLIERIGRIRVATAA